MRAIASIFLPLACVALIPRSAQAQVIDGPLPPVAPAVIARAVDGRATLRAVRLAQPLTFDGRLNDDIYAATTPITGFLQSIPDNGQPASQNTEVWIFFDRTAIYVAARCWDTRPENEWTANERRRDKIVAQDNFGVSLDTYYDRRSGYMFYANPLAARADVYVTNETNYNVDFNPVWEVQTGRFPGGWTVEMQIPFTSLRYRPGTSQVWGVQLRRNIRARNEWSYITLLPASIGNMGLVRMSLMPALVGLELPSGSGNLEIKPYAIMNVSTDHLSVPTVLNDTSAAVGFDVKYGLTQNLTADFTYNTDVAAAEADDQQVNLTRFNLSLPEKRDFFLEGRDLFAFGTPGPSLFYSRKIGLNRGRVVPIIAGGRLNGKIGRTSIGLLNIETGEEAVTQSRNTNFTVMRVRQDVLRRSTIGAIVTRRSRSLVKPDEASTAYGVDGAFGFHDNINLDMSYARANSPDARDKASYAATFAFDPDAWGLSARHLFIADGFNPEIGFVTRDDIRETALTARVSPRPESVPHVERFAATTGLTYTLNTSGVLESWSQTAAFATEFEHSDSVTASARHDFDRLFVPFSIAPGITIPAGDYHFNTVRASVTLGPQRRLSGTLVVTHGGYYGGRQSTTGYNGRVTITKALALQPGIDVRWIRLPGGSFVSQLWRTRFIYTLTPKMFLAGLIQYNTSSHTIGLNFRLRWEYSTGSELFIVYNENQNAEPRGGGFAELFDRAVAVKITRLLQF